MTLLPISDYKERLLGRKLVTTKPSFKKGRVKIFHCQPGPSRLDFQAVSSSPLQKLPAELRLYILTKVFEDVKPMDWLSAHHHAGATPASVIFSCKQMYLEGSDLALKACTFRYEDLPGRCRIIGPGCQVTCDYQEER